LTVYEFYCKTITQIISDKQTVITQEWFQHIRTYSNYCTAFYCVITPIV